mgnify:CR=1 FL=1
MTLREMHKKVVTQVEKEIGEMSKIKDLRNDSLLVYDSKEFFGHFKRLGDVTVSIVFMYEDDNYPTYSIVSVREGFDEMEYFEYLTEEDMAKEDGYTDSDVDYAIDIALDVLDNILEDEGLSDE